MADELFAVEPVEVVRPVAAPRLQISPKYPYTRADGVAVAHPLNQEGWDGSIPISALQLRFGRVGFDTARQLVALWHSRLPNLHSGAAGGLGCYQVNYTAEAGGCWFATAIWTSPIALNRMNVDDPREIIELRRMAVSDLAPKNTASRMLGYMARDLFASYPALLRLISYQDTAVHDGTIYRASGWAAGAATAFQTWNGSKGRGRSAIQQAPTPKVRWEKARNG